MRRLILSLGIAACLASAGEIYASNTFTGPVPLPQGIESMLNQVLSNAQLDRGYIAVVPLVKLSPNGAGCRTMLGQYIAERVGTSLIQRGGKTVERSRLDAALEEIDFNRRPTFDQARAQQLGRLAGASYILTGTHTEMVNTVEVDARLFSTDTGANAGAAYVTLVKDQDILRLLGTGEEGCAGSGGGGDSGQRQDGNVQAKPLQTDTKNGVRVDLLGCQISGARVTCSAMMTQTSGGYNHVVGGADGSYVRDAEGNQYLLSRVKMGAKQGGWRVDNDLAANVPTRIEVVFEGVPTGLRQVRVLVLATYQQKFVFENVGLSR